MCLFRISGVFAFIRPTEFFLRIQWKILFSVGSPLYFVGTLLIKYRIVGVSKISNLGGVSLLILVSICAILIGGVKMLKLLAAFE